MATIAVKKNSNGLMAVQVAMMLQILIVVIILIR